MRVGPYSGPDGVQYVSNADSTSHLALHHVTSDLLICSLPDLLLVTRSSARYRRDLCLSPKDIPKNYINVTQVTYKGRYLKNENVSKYLHFSPG